MTYWITIKDKATGEHVHGCSIRLPTHGYDHVGRLTVSHVTALSLADYAFWDAVPAGTEPKVRVQVHEVAPR